MLVLLTVMIVDASPIANPEETPAAKFGHALAMLRDPMGEKMKTLFFRFGFSSVAPFFFFFFFVD